MEFSRVTRVLLLLCLLAVLFSLLVFGGIDRPPAPELGDYPGTDEFVEAPGDYQGQQVTVNGRVVSTDPVVIRSKHGTAAGIEHVELTVTAVDATVELDDHLQVFGVLKGPRTIEATTVVLVPRTGVWYTWTISFLAGLWVLGRIISHWRIDIETGALVPRAVSLAIFSWVED